ncbi:MAG: hypothetical protein HY391_04590, partial [Deltaproteobacteria bacterium]|nr:hypothetical protein [Deltaproteobacteria bacterium]
MDVPPDLEITIEEIEEEAVSAELYKAGQKKKEVKREDERDGKNPIRIGEGIVLEMSWFGIPALDVTIETPALVEINGRKAYRVVGKAE